MNTSKENCDKLIDLLVDKTLNKGCVFTWNHDWWTVNFVDLSGRIFAFSLSGDMHDLPYVNQERKWEYKYSMFTKGSDDWRYVEVLGHPIYLGYVLEKMSESTPRSEEINLLNLWAKCGFSQSLQEIIEKSGWEEEKVPYEGWNNGDGIIYDSGCSCHINPPCSYCENSTYIDVLKSPEARALVEYLLHLFPINNEE